MDLSQLKNTSDAQFEKDVTFKAMLPDEDGGSTETNLALTVKSARNPEIAAHLAKLIADMEKERAKLDKPNVPVDQYKTTLAKVNDVEKAIAKLVLVKFDGLTDGDKPYACTKASMAKLVDEHSWVRSNIVKQATNEWAFYEV